MSDNTNSIDINAVEARRDELVAEHASIWRIHNDTVETIPGRTDLRDMDARREAVTNDLSAALDDQERVRGELVETAERAVEWAQSVLDGGDYSDGLDGKDGDELRRTMDRAVIRNDMSRALAAAQLLDADGDHTAMPRLSANFPDVGVALNYIDTYADPMAVLDSTALRMSTVKLPDDSRIAPTREVAQRHAREDAEIRAGIEAARLEARKDLHSRTNSMTAGVARSDESRNRVRRAPFGHGG